MPWYSRRKAVTHTTVRYVNLICKIQEVKKNVKHLTELTLNLWACHCIIRGTGTVKHVCLWRKVPQQMLRTHRSLKAYCATLWWKWRERRLDFFSFFQVMKHRWNEIDRGKPKYSGKNLSQCHFVHHKSHMDWPRDRTRSSAVGGRRLTAWAMARPSAFYALISASFSVHIKVTTNIRFPCQFWVHRRRNNLAYCLQLSHNRGFSKKI
jgi:hypothetical protein